MSGICIYKTSNKERTIEKMGWFGKQMAIAPEKVGEMAVRNMLKGKFIIIPGLLPKVISLFVKFIPDNLLVYVYEKLIEKSK
jgi:short-subunit dehydrogenase